ncbi:hypothetical protein Tco_0817021 [Tanacetum coccineum]
MSTQQDIYAASSENRPPMLNKENYVSWSSCILCYVKSRPNRKLIYNSIMNGPYVRRMIPEPGDADRKVPVNETFHEQTEDELTEKELKQVEADNQSIQTILLGFPEDIYVAVDSCETVQEIWLRVQQMMKGSDIGIQEKKAKLFNEWDSRHVTIVHQTKDLHTADDTQLYDFLKYNQKEVDDLRAERLAKTQDPLALMAISNNPFNYPVFHPDQPSSKTLNENVELEFQVQNYEKENAHLKTAYKNLFDSINVTWDQTKMIIDSLQNKLHDIIYENAKLRAQLFDKVLNKRTPQKVDKTNDLSNPVTSNSVPTTRESKVVENDKVIAPGMFRINPFKNSREEMFVPNKPIKASVRTNPSTVSQPHVITKKVINSDSNGFSSTRVDIITRTRRLQLRSNTKNDRVSSASKSSRIKNKEVEVEERQFTAF